MTRTLEDGAWVGRARVVPGAVGAVLLLGALSACSSGSFTVQAPPQARPDVTAVLPTGAYTVEATAGGSVSQPATFAMEGFVDFGPRQGTGECSSELTINIDLGSGSKSGSDARLVMVQQGTGPTWVQETVQGKTSLWRDTADPEAFSAFMDEHPEVFENVSTLRLFSLPFAVTSTGLIEPEGIAGGFLCSLASTDKFMTLSETTPQTATLVLDPEKSAVMEDAGHTRWVDEFVDASIAGGQTDLVKDAALRMRSGDGEPSLLDRLLPMSESAMKESLHVDTNAVRLLGGDDYRLTITPPGAATAPFTVVETTRFEDGRSFEITWTFTPATARAVDVHDELTYFEQVATGQG